MALTIESTVSNGTAKLTLAGELDAAVASQFKEAVEKAAAQTPKKLVLFMAKLQFMASAGLRVLVFAKQKMGAGVAIYVVGAQGPVLNTLTLSGFHQAVYIQDTYTE